MDCAHENASLACMRVVKHSSCMSAMQMFKAIIAQLSMGHHNRSKPTRSRRPPSAHEVRDQAGLQLHAEGLAGLRICS